MLAVIGEILPLTLGIAISPIPIIAAILMLLSPTARGTSVGFLVGWIAGILVAVSVFALLSSAIPKEDTDQTKPIVGVVQLALAVLILLVGLKEWRGRPRGDEEPALPKWMQAIDSLTAAKALGLGFLLAAVNPKNLLMAIAAGLAIGAAGLGTGSAAVAVLIFTLLAGSTVAIPVISYLVASERMADPLETLRTWLVHTNATVMSILMLVIGFVMLGNALGNFQGVLTGG